MTRMFTILLPFNTSDGKTSVSFKIKDISPSPQQVSDFFSIDSLIKVCVTNAEAINGSLKSYILQLLCNNQDERQIIRFMDFMNLKDYLVDYIKKNKHLQQIPITDTPEKFKTFRKDFNAFILDRNIYTHGQLKFFRPTSQFVIQYDKKPSGTPGYVVVNSEILISYNKYYLTLQQFLVDFHKLYNEIKKSIK